MDPFRDTQQGFIRTNKKEIILQVHFPKRRIQSLHRAIKQILHLSYVRVRPNVRNGSTQTVAKGSLSIVYYTTRHKQFLGTEEIQLVDEYSPNLIESSLVQRVPILYAIHF